MGVVHIIRAAAREAEIAPIEKRRQRMIFTSMTDKRVTGSEGAICFAFLHGQEVDRSDRLVESEMLSDVTYMGILQKDPSI